MEIKDSISKQSMGGKLASFRRKLAMAIGQKKITQGTFGEMYGSYSGRTIASYELGDSELPVALLYSLWVSGHSIDRFFAEGEITDAGRDGALKRYADSITVSVEPMDKSKREFLMKEAIRVKRDHDKPTKESASKTSGKRKAGPNPSSKSK